MATNKKETNVEVTEEQVKKAPLNILDALLGSDVGKIELLRKSLSLRDYQRSMVLHSM